MPVARRTIDNSGKQLTLRTRQGGDLRVRLRCWGVGDQGRQPLDLSLYTIIARIRDGKNAVRELPTSYEGSALTLHFTGELTAELPAAAACNFAVELKRDGTITPLFYGTLTCERSL